VRQLAKDSTVLGKDVTVDDILDPSKALGISAIGFV
jgi:hypothetical protein